MNYIQIKEKFNLLIDNQGELSQDNFEELLNDSIREFINNTFFWFMVKRKENTYTPDNKYEIPSDFQILKENALHTDGAYYPHIIDTSDTKFLILNYSQKSTADVYLDLVSNKLITTNAIKKDFSYLYFATHPKITQTEEEWLIPSNYRDLIPYLMAYKWYDIDQQNTILSDKNLKKYNDKLDDLRIINNKKLSYY